MTAPAMMTPRRFDWALRTRGPDLQAWPAPQRGEALLLLRSSAAARDALADALAAEEAAEVDAAALRRMGAAVRRALRPTPPVLRGVRWGVLAACVAAGLYLGLPGGDGDATGPLATFGSDSPAMVLAALE